MVNVTQQRDHFRGGVGGADAGVAVASAGSVQRLLLRVGRQNAEDYRHPSLNRHLLDASGALPGNIVKMGCISPNHAAEADHRILSPGPCDHLGGQGKLKRTGNAVNGDVAGVDAQLSQSP